MPARHLLSPVAAMALLLAAACGRLGFDDIEIDTGDASIRDAGASPDAEPIAVPETDLVVTTSEDEDDPTASASDPRGEGLSLREAIRIANVRPGHDVIAFARPMVIAIEIALPASSDEAGATIFGIPGEEPTVVIDGLQSEPCVVLDGAANVVRYLEVKSCSRGIVAKGRGHRIEGCVVRSNVDGLVIDGTGVMVGPGNRIRDNLDAGVLIAGHGNVVTGNVLMNNGDGVAIESGAGGSAIRLNVLHSHSDSAIAFLEPAGDIEIVHNTIDNNTTGIAIEEATSSSVVANNIVSSNGTGIHAARGSVDFGINGVFQSSLECPDCTGSIVSANPRYVDAAGRDYRLLETSPMIDAGQDLGLDVNGGAPGRYHGAAPDLGALEAP